MSVQIVKLLDPMSIVNIPGGLVPKGAYNNGTSYSVGDSVSYNGSSYVCITASTGNLPTDTAYWQLVASKGDTGATGLTGATGATGAPGVIQTVNGKTGTSITLDKTDVGLGNAENTSDADKPVSTAQQTALDGKQNADATLTALAAYNTNGILTQTAADTFTGRTITGTANQITVTNGNGVAGNPTLSLPQDIHTGANPTFAEATLTGSLTTPEIVMNSTSTGIASSTNSGLIRIFGGTLANGGGIILGGSSNAGAPNSILFRIGATTIASISGVGLSPNTDSTYTLGTPSLYWKETYTDKIFLNSTATLDGSTAGEIKGTGIFTADNIKRGTGFPEGVVTANVGTVYIDTAITNGASSWIKKSGTGSTGWQVLEGDTGWRNIGNITGITEQIKIRRVGPNVYFSQIGDAITINSVVTLSRLALPLGFRSSLRQVSELIATSGAKYGTMLVKSTETDLILTTTGTATFIAFGNGSFVTNDSYPTTLPGTPA